MMAVAPCTEYSLSPSLEGQDKKWEFMVLFLYCGFQPPNSQLQQRARFNSGDIFEFSNLPRIFYSALATFLNFQMFIGFSIMSLIPTGTNVALDLVKPFKRNHF